MGIDKLFGFRKPTKNEVGIGAAIVAAGAIAGHGLDTPKIEHVEAPVPAVDTMPENYSHVGRESGSHVGQSGSYAGKMGNESGSNLFYKENPSSAGHESGSYAEPATEPTKN